MSSTEQPEMRTAPSRSGAPFPASRVADGETLRTVRLPGLTLAVRALHERSGTPAGQRAGGPREPVLYVHGLGGSSQNWSALMRALAADVDGEAVDLPGFGDSPPPDSGDYSVSGHARAVVRYLDAAARGPVHLVGNSLGGSVATRVAAVRPDLVRTLTLISPALPEIPPQRGTVPTVLVAVPGVAGLFARLTRDWPPERRTADVLSLCYGDPSRVTADDFAAAVEEYQRRQRLPYFWDAIARSARGLVDAYTLGGQHALWRQAERVLAPTLLVYGGRDQLVSYRMARRAVAAFRDSRLLALPDAGHVAMMEYPEIVAPAVRELVQEGARLTRPPSGRDAAGSSSGNPEDPKGD
ncbi:alpha/beta fold hydrolase [Streptomyces boncukensis]|uniref:Alpha/beta hydrolase n=1 Tax=Streptomyces boncukensis TaxID=2711219 RepID=A0A6G4WZG9_9ACTN|nr:alpha/beta hydrolase [Streptomyces boncukensis]NGO70030.1 alpha/beta hydrolase [Streptomyces boncukensis]